MVKDELISSEVKPHSLHLLQGIEATKKLFPNSTTTANTAVIYQLLAAL